MKPDVKIVVLEDLISTMRKENVKKFKPEEKQEEPKTKGSNLLIRLAKLEKK